MRLSKLTRCTSDRWDGYEKFCFHIHKESVEMAGGRLTLSETSAFAEDDTLHVRCLLSSLTSPLIMKHTAIRKKILQVLYAG
jgi:hypothetical protein